MLELSYIAGFFDGEGCVSIGKRKTKKRKGLDFPLIVSLAQNRKEVLEQIQTQFGGTFYKPTHSKCWILTMNTRIAERFLRAILPHLIVKRAEVELALLFRSRIQKTNKKLTETEREERLYLIERLADLKHAN